MSQDETGKDRPVGPEKKPWPMSWVLVAIVAFVVLYTLVMIYFRKETDMFYPYEEAQAEMLGNLLRSEGWEPMPEAYVIREFRLSPEELGMAQRETGEYDKEETLGIEIGEHATTPLFLDRVTAPASLAAGDPYQAEIRWMEREDGAYPRGLSFFIRDGEILVFPPHGRIRPDEPEEPVTRFLIPPEQLATGEHTIFLYTEDGLRGWSFTVEED